MNYQQALAIVQTIARAKKSRFRFIGLEIAVDSAYVYFESDLANPVNVLGWFKSAGCETDGMIGRAVHDGEWCYHVQFWLKAVEAVEL